MEPQMSNKDKTFSRDTDGLRDMIMSEIEDVRSGVATPDEARAIADLAGRIIETFHADFTKQRMEDARERENYDRKEREAKRLRIAAKKAAMLSIQGPQNECAA
jgi:hypothetical protein